MQLRYGTPNEAGMLAERVAHARDPCARWVTEEHTPTLSVCVARHGVIVLHEAFGILGPGPDSPRLERNALFPIMSITKAITATLVMQLVEDGLLGLNRPAKDYLPEICGDGTDDILVHHLLTHTTGAAVAAMTRDQIQGLGARLLLKVVDRASWGYGWQVVSPTKWKYFDGSLQPLGTFGHPGAGGVNYWIDRGHDLVGAYFEVTTRLSPDYNLLWNFDLFQNAITAAVED